jgi:hypothetical protein
MIKHGTTLPLLFDQPASGEKSQVVGQRRGGQTGTLLNLSDRETVGPGANERKQYLQPRPRPDRRKTLCCLVKVKHH